MFGFEMWQVAALVGSVLGAALLVRLIFTKDDEVEDRRRNALHAAAELRKIGDDQLADVLEAYAIGDYTGIASEVQKIIRVLLKPDGVIEMRANLVFKLLPELLKGEKYDANLRKVIAQAISNHEFSLTVEGETSATK